MHNPPVRRAVVAIIIGVAALSGPGAEEVFIEPFDAAPSASLFAHTWGDRPTEVLANGAEPDIGLDGGPGAHLKLLFGKDAEKNLSYWTYRLPRPVPLVKGLRTVSFRVKANVPAHLKIGLAPFGFIYHGPRRRATGDWETLTLNSAYDALADWCRGGDKDPDRARIDRLIVAIGQTKDVTADIALDDFLITGRPGINEAIYRRRIEQRYSRVRLAAASLPWDAKARTLDAAIDAIEHAACDGADLVALPQECIPTDGQPIPGGAFNELAHTAAHWGIHVVGCLRERDAENTYLTAFLIDPSGELVGKYRKSHKLPHENIALGDELPVFDTSFGKIGITIGTDHYFPEIDRVLAAKGAGTIVWCTAPWPWRNEFPIDIALRGRAYDFGLNYVVPRYYGVEGYGGYDTHYSGYTARWPIGRAYVIRHGGLVVASTPYDGGGVATATLNANDVARRGRGPSRFLKEGLYHEIADPTPPPNDAEYAKRRIRVAVVECENNFDGLLEKLNRAGQMGADIVGNWEYVWSTKLGPEECQRRLDAIAEIAAKHQMYIVFGGYLDREHYNDGLIWDRSGDIIGRFTKIHVTTFGRTVGQIGGKRCPVFETDFGRIAIKICADEGSPEIDRVYGLKRADIIFHPTQSAGPYAAARELRDRRRAIDNGCWFVSANGPTAEADHRSFIIDPWGYIVAASNFREASVFTHDIDLDNRPGYYNWPDTAVSRPGAPDPWKQDQTPKRVGDLREAVMSRRRPELYSIIGAAPAKN